VLFRYDRKLIEDFPQTAFGFVYGEGLQVARSDERLRREFTEEQQTTLERVGHLSPADIPSLAAWRRTFSAFGVSPTKYRSAAEALLRRLRTTGEIPSINNLVDIGNLISLRYSLPVLVYDEATTQGMVRIGYSRGTEVYRELHRDTHVTPAKGEVIFCDEADQVIARRWCWRQSSYSAVTEETRRALLLVEAQHETGLADVRKATLDARTLIANYAAGEEAKLVDGFDAAANLAR